MLQPCGYIPRTQVGSARPSRHRVRRTRRARQRHTALHVARDGRTAQDRAASPGPQQAPKYAPASDSMRRRTLATASCEEVSSSPQPTISVSSSIRMNDAEPMLPSSHFHMSAARRDFIRGRQNRASRPKAGSLSFFPFGSRRRARISSRKVMPNNSVPSGNVPAQEASPRHYLRRESPCASAPLRIITAFASVSTLLTTVGA